MQIMFDGTAEIDELDLIGYVSFVCLKALAGITDRELLVDDDVLIFDVAMDDAETVEVEDDVDDLGKDLFSLRLCEALVDLDALKQIHARPSHDRRTLVTDNRAIGGMLLLLLLLVVRTRQPLGVVWPMIPARAVQLHDLEESE